MKDKMEFVENYQCPGCVGGPSPECYENDGRTNEVSCTKHTAGTLIAGVGKIFIALPTGFCRLGPCEDMRIFIFMEFEEYDKFNVPVWKYLDEEGNTIVRGISPRINTPFLHIFKGDHRSEIDCIEITNEDLESMD